MEKKYVLRPGYIESQYDGDIHFISATTLASLYGVDIGECMIRYNDRRYCRYDIEKMNRLINLFPRRSGDYSLESCVNLLECCPIDEIIAMKPREE